MPDDWITPTGDVDHGVWTQEWQARNDNLGDYANELIHPGWGGFLDLTHASLSCDKIRVYLNGIGAGGLINVFDIDLFYNGMWNDLYQGNMSKLVWVEFAIGSTEDVTAMRIRAQNNGVVDGRIRLHEADFNQVPAPVSKKWWFNLSGRPDREIVAVL